MNLFHSARIKLTGFYFAVFVVLCLILSFGVRAFTSYELNKGDDAQRTTAHELFKQYSDEYNIDTDPGTGAYPKGAIPFGDRYFSRAIQDQSDTTRRHLSRDLLYLDILLLVGGALVSYWYAGRTLHPIEEAHEQQKRFTADASHELRTPLASMKLENEVFLRQKHFEEKDAREQIASNLEEVDRLERLATNLLALNQYEHEPVTKQAVAVVSVVDEAVERARQRFGKHVYPKFTIKIAPATVQTDRESLVELLTILIDNAAKYGPKDGEVIVGGEKRGEGYVLAVRDHGPGIADDDMPHIFDRMYRGDKARSSRVGGHGIGLSLAKQIAEANGASIEASNHPDGGALFIVNLP